MVLKQYHKVDQKYGTFCQMNEKCQPPSSNLRLILKSGSLKNIHVDYVRLTSNIYDLPKFLS